MGAGIAAAIPIAIKVESSREEYFSNQFFTHYDKASEKEFYELIGETEKLDKMEIPSISTFDEFEDYFSRNNQNRKSGSPFLYGQFIAFSFLGGQSSYYWHFYNGSYKAYIEVYSTFRHFESILQRTMKNPLAHVLKFGIFG